MPRLSSCAKPSAVSAAACATGFSARCAYLLVVEAWLCPKILPIIGKDFPLLAAYEAKAWRKSCIRHPEMPPALQMRFHVSFTLIIWPLPHLPGKQYSLTRGRAEITSHAVGGMGRIFAPVFELGSSAFSLDSLKYSHF